MTKKKSIVTQTVLRVSMIFVVVIILLVVSFTGFISTYMRQRILENQQGQMNMVTDSFEIRTHGLMEMAVSLAKYQPTISWLSGTHEPYSAFWMENKRNLDSYLQNVNLFTEYIVDINLLDANGESRYSLRNILRSGYPYGQQEWFKRATEQEEVIKYVPPHGNEHLYNENMKDTFSLIYPIYHSNRLIGYELIECDLLGIADFLDTKKTNESGYLLFDEKNECIFGKNDRKTEKMLTMLNETERGKDRIYEEDGSLYIMYRFKSNNWVLILESDEGILWQPIKKLFIIIGVLGIFAVLLLFGVNLYNIRMMEKPFNRLINRINSYDGSDTEAIKEYEDAPQELAIIGTRFEKMAGKMHNLINEVYIAQLKQKEAELEALVNQINPHFLYNVFQLIQTKAVLADNQEIEDMIQALSTMMRYAMDRKRDSVRVSDELNYIRNYLMFYKERFPRLFVYEINGEEAVGEYKIMKFILQPVIENCFKHAFKDKRDGGIIRIEICHMEQDIVFEVWDNGCGIPRDRLMQIQKTLAEELHEGGIGIVNTNERIRLVYGYPYGISIESQVDEYTKVTLRVKKDGIYV